MKKVGIISIHYGVNFGSALQAYALSRFVEEHFPDTRSEVINYIPPRYRNRVRYHYTGPKSIKKFLGWVSRLPEKRRNNLAYIRYLKSCVNISPELYDMVHLKERYKDYDFLITGSDQVWNSDYNQGVDPMYYLQFAGPGTPKIAYAASCGKNDFPATEWNEMRNLLSDFRAISVREVSTQKLMQENGVEGCRFVLDPTFLLDPSEWKALEKSDMRVREPYLLIYFLDTDGDEIVQLANRIAKEKSLKTVLILNHSTKKKYPVDYVICNELPDKYIWLFRNAAFVVTNSFHGVSFSINLGRQFVAVRKEKYNARIDSILGVMGIPDRLVAVNECSQMADIDYEAVNRRKAILREQSILFLEEVFQE